MQFCQILLLEITILSDLLLLREKLSKSFLVCKIKNLNGGTQKIEKKIVKIGRSCRISNNTVYAEYHNAIRVTGRDERCVRMPGRDERCVCMPGRDERCVWMPGRDEWFGKMLGRGEFVGRMPGRDECFVRITGNNEYFVTHLRSQHTAINTRFTSTRDS